MALVSNVLICPIHEAVGPARRVVRPEEDLAWLKKVYVAFVTRALNHRFLVVMVTLAGLAWAGGLLHYKIVQVEMFPDIDFDYIYITIETPPGTEVGVISGISARVESIVRERVPEAVRVVSTIGYKGASAFEISVGTGEQSNFAEVTVELLDGKEYARARQSIIQQRIRPLPGRHPRGQNRIPAPGLGTAPVRARGNENPGARTWRSCAACRPGPSIFCPPCPGPETLKTIFPTRRPNCGFAIDRDSAASLGVPLDALAMTLRGATAGLDVREFRDELDQSRKYDLRVRFSPESRTTTGFLERIKVRAATGALVPLSNIASFSQGPGINAIRHIDRRRMVRVTAQNEGRSAVEVAKEFQDAPGSPGGPCRPGTPSASAATTKTPKNPSPA